MAYLGPPRIPYGVGHTHWANVGNHGRPPKILEFSVIGYITPTTTDGTQPKREVQ